MHFQSALSTAPSLDAAIRDVTEALRQALGRGGVDLCTVFVHPHYGDIDTVGARLRKALDARHLIGCTAAGVCGADREIEGRPALAVAAGRLPATTSSFLSAAGPAALLASAMADGVLFVAMPISTRRTRKATATTPSRPPPSRSSPCTRP